MDETISKLVNHYDDFIKKLGKFDSRITGLDALFIWQFVRFNPLYRIEYDLCRECLFEEWLCASIYSIFGISEPVNYNNPELPLGFSFNQTIVNKFNFAQFLNNDKYQRKIQKDLSRLIKPKLTIFNNNENDPVVGFAVDINDDPDTVVKMIKYELIELREKRKVLGLPIEEIRKAQNENKNDEEDDDINDEEFIKFRGSSTKNVLIDWLITHHYKEEANLTWSKITEKHKQLTGKKPDPTQMKRQISKFKRLAKHSPYSFFLQTN